MSAPSTTDELLDLARRSGVVDVARLEAVVAQLASTGPLPGPPAELAKLLVQSGVLTNFQAEQLLKGKWRGFTIGKYQILERLGSGGMGVVYLAQHRRLGRRVALKVLPVALAKDPWFLDRFYQEAQAVAALDHPNIVHAHDVGQEGGFHYLVMEYVDGASLQEIVNKRGPMDPVRAAHCVRQVAHGLHHAHQAGLTHRDIKPGNLLLDRKGTVKILDMGLACFATERPAKGRDKQRKDRLIVGTDDYLAPEQIVDSEDVDSRADIYSLGATLYFLLTAKSPFEDVLPSHKLIWHLTRSPKRVRELRPEVPAALETVIEKMMAKNPWDRYQLSADVVVALSPWTQGPVPVPPASEMPRLSPALQGLTSRPVVSLPATPPSSKRSWVFSDTAAPAQTTEPSAEAPAPQHTK